MRPFRFRAWNNGKFEYFDLHNITVPDRVLMSEKYPVQQFTGLNDKNGKEIYEGDIIKFSRLFEEDRKIKELTSCVRFDKGKFGFDLVGFNGMFYDLSDDCNIEVIGNIFEDNA